MTVEYSLSVKTARMQVVLSSLVGGAAELLEGETVVARVPLEGGKLLGPLLTFELADGLAMEDGDPTRARLVDHRGESVVTGLTVGRTNADVLIDSAYLRQGQTVRILAAALRHA